MTKINFTVLIGPGMSPRDNLFGLENRFICLQQSALHPFIYRGNPLTNAFDGFTAALPSATQFISIWEVDGIYCYTLIGFNNTYSTANFLSSTTYTGSSPGNFRPIEFNNLWTSGNFYSSNGITSWTACTTDSGAHTITGIGTRVECNNTVAVCVLRTTNTSGSYKLHYSTNGTDWLQTSVASFSSSFCDIAYFNGTFFVTNDNLNEVLTSTDGTNWTSTALNIGIRYGVNTDGKSAFVLGSSEILITLDGVTWARITTPTSDVQLFRGAIYCFGYLWGYSYAGNSYAAALHYVID